MKTRNLIDAIAPRLTELMIQRIGHLETDWQKPWITDLDHGLPRNLRGTPYRAGNILMLLFLSGIAGYQTPIFMTFRQAKREGAEYPQGLQVISGLLLEDLYPSQGDPP